MYVGLHSVALHDEEGKMTVCKFNKYVCTIDQ